MSKLNEAILAVQNEVGVLSKDKDNPFYKSKYLDINSLLHALTPILSKHGITVTQPLTNIEGLPSIATIICKDEERLEYVFPFPNIIKPQEMGSCITYYRRYALQSYFLLQAEDDDANLVSSPEVDIKPIYKPKKYQRDDRNDNF